MIHPLLRLVVTQPHLVTDHAQAYGGLISEEVSKTIAAIKLKAILFVIAALLLLFGLLLAGVSALLAASVPHSSMPAGWILIVFPCILLVGGAVCVFVALGKPTHSFSELKQQLSADMSMLREASAA